MLLRGGISQEVFFRAALLSVLTASFKTKPSWAVVIQSMLFALWHVPKAYLAAATGKKHRGFCLGVSFGSTAVRAVFGVSW